MGRPAWRRHRGKPSPRADRDRRSLGFYRRDVSHRRQRASPDRWRYRGRSRDLASAMAQDGFRYRERSDAGSAEKRLDAAGRPQRQAQRTSRASAQRTAIDAADISGGHMVIDMRNDVDLRHRAWHVAAAVVQPESPVLTIGDLGLRGALPVTDGRVEVAITPTYSGCPA